MFTTIELFAGAGGLALGIEKAGFKTLALNEFNADACATLRKNRPNWNVIEGDVAEISGLDLEEYFSVRKGEPWHGFTFPPLLRCISARP